MRGVAACLLLLLSATVQAHTRSQSTSTWHVHEKQLSGVFQVEAVRATQLISAPDQITTLPAVVEDHVARTISASQKGMTCISKTKRLAAPAGVFRVELIFRCPERIAASPVTLSITSFRAQSASHLHFVRVQPDSSRAQEWLLTGETHTLQVGGPAPQQPSGFFAFVKLGTVHVLSGLDHIAFLLGLLLMARTPARVLMAVTGFTLGHSLTLAAVVLGKLQPDTAAIESLIGFSVAFAALDVARSNGLLSRRGILAICLLIALTPAWMAAHGRGITGWVSSFGIGIFTATFLLRTGATNRWLTVLLASCFGLVHGAGFAGLLIDMKLPPSDMVRPLLGFNIGVELGQLVVIGLAAASALRLRRLAPSRLPALEAAGLAILTGLGSFWFVSRW